MSDEPTPRTDAQINGKPCTRFAIMAGDSLRDALVPSEFARELERENARLREELAAIRSGQSARTAIFNDVAIAPEGDSFIW